MHDQHVDIVRNDWLGRAQECVARVRVYGGDIVVEADDPYWEELARRPIVDIRSGDSVHPQKEPERFLKLLVNGLNSSYVFATRPHSDAECPFNNGWRVPLGAEGLQLLAG